MWKSAQRRATGFAYLSIVLALLLASQGCNEETKRVSREAAKMTQAFDALVKAGKTTEKQERDYLVAMSGNIIQIYRHNKGTKAAIQVQNGAQVQAATGINPKGPAVLDGNATLTTDLAGTLSQAVSGIDPWDKASLEEGVRSFLAFSILSISGKTSRTQNQAFITIAVAMTSKIDAYVHGLKKVP